MQNIIKDCMSGQLTDAQIAAFLALMRMKGETVDELTATAEVMQEMAHPIDLGDDLLDIVGTGGDGKNTFNVSTVSSFVAAAAGLRLAKHGGRASSSHCGSADLLLQAGFKLDLSDNKLRQCLEQCGIVFLFAPLFHQTLQYAKDARQELGIRTLFNLVCPLINPARAKKQVVGVYAKRWLNPIAQVLANLGSKHVLVVHSQDGLDEISIAAPTDIVEYHEGKFKEWTLDPRDYACAHPNLDDIIVTTAEQSLELAEGVFAGIKGPARDIILLNTAAALYCADVCSNFPSAIAKAAATIDSGLAGKCFRNLRDLTNN